MKNDYLVKKTYNSFMMISVLSVLAATFDPIAYSDSNEGRIGLKLVRGLTQDIEYSYNLILNELRVKL